ncbi:MAG: DUF1513 domain-containing protein [Bacteriovoracia bacterium]
MQIDRRRFLQQITLCAGGLALLPFPGQVLAKAARFSAKKRANQAHGSLLQLQPKKLAILDLATEKNFLMDIENEFGHSVLGHKEKFAVLIDQAGPLVSVVDLEKKKSIAKIRANAGGEFSGHGCFSPDGNILYLAEYPAEKTAHGSVRRFETKTWKQIGSFSSGGAQSHYIIPLKGGAVLAVGHYGRVVALDKPYKDGVLTLLDATSGRILDTISAKNEFHSLCHIDKTSDDRLVISTRAWINKTLNGKIANDNFSTPVVFGSPFKKDWHEARPTALAEAMRLSLTVKIDEGRRAVLVAHMKGRRVSKWNIDSSALLCQRDFGDEEPMGVGLDPNSDLYLATTTHNKLHFLAPHDLSTVRTVALPPTDRPAPHFEILSGSFS